MFENVFIRIFGLMKEDVTGRWRKLYNSVALVRERNIPTERPPLGGEVSANFCG
jgi:hypothetical protein